VLSQPVVAVAQPQVRHAPKRRGHPVAWGTHERDGRTGPIESLAPLTAEVKQLNKCAQERPLRAQTCRASRRRLDADETDAVAKARERQCKFNVSTT